MATMNWSLAEVEERQAIFSTALVKHFMKKLRKYQNLMLKHGVNVTDSGYGSDIHTTNSNDDDIELVLPENSSAIASCKSFWTFGAQASIVRLFQWVYKIVQRMKAARILYHLDTVPENEIEATIVEVANELSIAFEYQLMMLYNNTEVIKLAKHGVDCLMTYLNSYGSEFTTASLLQAVIEVKPLTGNKKEIIKTREIGYKGKNYCLCWKLWQVLKQPGLRVSVTDTCQDITNGDIEEIPIDSDSEEVFLAEIHLSINDHVVIEEINYSSELEVQEENDSGKPSETDDCNMSDDKGETSGTVESEMVLKTEDVIKYEDFGKAEIRDANWMTFDERVQGNTSLDTDCRSGSFDARNPCTCAIIDEGNLTSTVTISGENDFPNTSAITDESNSTNTSTIISGENNLPNTSAIINEVSLPSAIVAGKKVSGKNSNIAEINPSNMSMLIDKNTVINKKEITDENNRSADPITDECSLESTNLINGNLSQTTAAIGYDTNISVFREAKKKAMECPNDAGQTKEDYESKTKEDIVSKLPLEQETGAVSAHIKHACPDSESEAKDIVVKIQSEQRNGAVLAHIRDEYQYIFYGCFTPYGAKCRPKVYGFRGPLHAWNEQKCQVDLVFNDKVTVIDCRARHIPFTADDKHMAYIPKTCCKH